MAYTRKELIEQRLDSTGSVTLKELTVLFPDVSSMTLRRDLIQLEEAGIAIRIKGGAIKDNNSHGHLGEESAYELRENKNIEAKKIIATKAMTFLETGRAIYLDAGSTIMTFAKLLPDHEYSFVTSGINTATSLLQKEHPSVILLGGYANRNTLSLSGPLSKNILESINIDIAYISASGYTRDNHFTVSNIYEAELKKYIISKAKKVIVLIDSTKIGNSLPYTFAQTSEIDYLITEVVSNKEFSTYLSSENVTLI